MLITFANSLDPDQARHNVEPDFDPDLFDTLMVYLKDFLEKKIADDMKACMITLYAKS